MEYERYVLPLLMNMIILLLICCVIHLERHVKTAEHEKRIAKEQYEQLESRTQVMLSQIQPHFMNNTLTAIYYLCGKDPLQAKKLTLNFAEYFRANMDSINRKEPIPFEEELAHTRNYLEIEQLRYGDILHVVYDIRETDFKIPALTLQPLVENAVNHGVRSREEGGTVILSTKRENDKIYITVQDDGMGFDLNALKEEDGSHAGIRNIRNRLHIMHGARLQMDSEIGLGTRASIILEETKSFT